MKVLGIIAEYNPFHNGHAYQIAQARKAYGADYVIIAMSGNYVQRGTPALLDKFTRTKMALMGGADMVFELPVLWACASAEYFAAAGTSLLDKTGIVDAISFGCETEDFGLLQDVGQLLAQQEDGFMQELLFMLKSGKTYPAAREEAFLKFLLDGENSHQLNSHALSKNALSDKLHLIFRSPNNILALEYLKALTARHAAITPIPILRNGSGYHEQKVRDNFSSATAIRNALLTGFSNSGDFIPANVPPFTASILASEQTVFLSEDDFSLPLYYKLWSESAKGFETYADCSAGLSNRIINLLPKYQGYANFNTLLKRRETTYTRISRMFLHILLNIKSADMTAGKALDYIPYFRLLGFRREASHLLSLMKKNSTVPLLSKAAAAPDLLTGSARDMFLMDVNASDLYYKVMGIKTSAESRQEYEREIIIIP